jgi:DNA modification methylase
MENKIYNCSILDGFKSIPDNSINLIVTSPPYNLSILYDSWNDNLPWNEYLQWCYNILKKIYIF